MKKGLFQALFLFFGQKDIHVRYGLEKGIGGICLRYSLAGKTSIFLKAQHKGDAVCIAVYNRGGTKGPILHRPLG